MLQKFSHLILLQTLFRCRRGRTGSSDAEFPAKKVLQNSQITAYFLHIYLTLPLMPGRIRRVSRLLKLSVRALLRVPHSKLAVGCYGTWERFGLSEERLDNNENA